MPPPSSSRRAPSILVVDDDPSTTDFIAEVLKLHACVPRVAHDGPEALQHVEAGRVDALIVDLRMPGMDGLALLRRIREISAGRDGSGRRHHRR
jgi:CheY-like chemotaxis protein